VITDQDGGNPRLLDAADVIKPPVAVRGNLVHDREPEPPV
jgi:hypothetical protein